MFKTVRTPPYSLAFLFPARAARLPCACCYCTLSPLRTTRCEAYTSRSTVDHPDHLDPNPQLYVVQDRYSIDLTQAHVLDHADHMASTREHELDHTRY